MIYLIAGKIKVGKDRIGNMIKDIYESKGKSSVIVPISGPLRDYAIKYFGWDGKEETKVLFFVLSLWFSFFCIFSLSLQCYNQDTNRKS